MAAKKKKKVAKKTAAKRAKRAKRATPLDRVRSICVDFPEFTEVRAWNAPTFRVKNKLFAMFAEEGNHHSYERPSLWIKASPANQQLMIRNAPEKFFKPPYVGPSGWVGVYVDKNVDWDEVASLLEDGYRMVAPKRVLAAFDAMSR